MLKFNKYAIAYLFFYTFVGEIKGTAIPKSNKINILKIMKKLNSLKEVSEFLNAKYSKVSDFNTYVSGTRIKGGFYKMSYNGRPDGEYYFHETFGYIDPEQGVSNFDELFNYLNASIQKQLKGQKGFDEQYAKEYGKAVNYQFDYSVIDA